MKDRLATFQDLLKLQEDILDAPDAVNSQVPAFDEVTQDFLTRVDTVYEQINHIKELIIELKECQSTVLTDAFLNQEHEEALEKVAKEIQKKSGESHKEIKAIQKELSLESAEVTDATDRLKQAQASALLVLFKEAMNDYYECQTKHSENCKNRITRQLKMIGKEKSDAEIEEMIAKGNFQVDTQIQTEEAEAILEKVKSRHEDLLLLEKSIHDLNTMFKEMFYLVQAQGDMIDNIERNVQTSADVIQKAVPKLNTAYRYRRRRLMYCCPCFRFCSVL